VWPVPIESLFGPSEIPNPVHGRAGNRFLRHVPLGLLTAHVDRDDRGLLPRGPWQHRKPLRSHRLRASPKSSRIKTARAPGTPIVVSSATSSSWTVLTKRSLVSRTKVANG